VPTLLSWMCLLSASMAQEKSCGTAFYYVSAARSWHHLVEHTIHVLTSRSTGS
jgi:hypothetical protein